jgi:diguanylate cyclase (GGDEF)-like protein
MDDQCTLLALEQAFRAYLDEYLQCRNLALVRQRLTTDTTGFGTGLDETTFGPLSALALFQRDIESTPEPVTYQIHQLRAKTLAENVGLVLADMDIVAQISGQSVHLRHLRMTTVWRLAGTLATVEHFHVSLPTTEHGEDESYPIKELEDRNLVLQRMVAQRTQQLEAALASNQTLASHDALTGLINRRALDDALSHELNRLQRYRSDFCVLMLDIDFFKSVNDRFGHMAGDRFLQQFAAVVSERLRNTDALGRWGGEEFLLICPQTRLDAALALAESVRRTVADTDFGLESSHSVSIGVAQANSADSIESLMGRADACLYQAKQSGRNRVVGPA